MLLATDAEVLVADVGRLKGGGVEDGAAHEKVNRLGCIVQAFLDEVGLCPACRMEKGSFAQAGAVGVPCCGTPPAALLILLGLAEDLRLDKIGAIDD